MSARITMNLTSDGVLELWLNEEGRDLLVRELQALDMRNEHFQLGSWEGAGADLQLSTRAYRPTDTVLEAGKVMLRTDEWDRTYFPHVMGELA